jgi:hypothetical protein
MIASEIARELERIVAPATQALKVQEDQIEGLLIAQYNFTITISKLEAELADMKHKNDELWKELNWKRETI